MRLLVFAVCFAGCAAEPEPLVVFAAASMTDVAADLATAYEEAIGVPVVVSTGATSLLARQISAGAPADAALLVGDDWSAWLYEAALTPEQPTWRPTETASGALAIAISREAPAWEDLREIAGVERIAIADPASVPAGAYARVMLQRAELWDAVSPRLVPLPHVRAALAAVETGQADAAVVYASDLLVSDRVREAVPIPDAFQPTVVFHCIGLRHEAASEEDFCSFAHRRSDLWRARGFRPTP